MKYLALLPLIMMIFSSSAFAHQKLLLIGGGKRPPEALKKWVSFTQNITAQDSKRSGKVLIITWASNIPADVDAGIRKNLGEAGAEMISSFSGPKNLAEKKLLLDQINTASGVFFSGGNQRKILEVLEDQDILNAIKNAYWRHGVPFAGTSAGTAIMSEVMILGESMGVGPGLGFLPNAVVDQHFLKRNRQDRLRKALSLAPKGFIGVGVEEDGSILWQNSEDGLEFKGEVYGEKQVMLFKPIEGASHFEESLLEPHGKIAIKFKSIPVFDCNALLKSVK